MLRTSRGRRDLSELAAALSDRHAQEFLRYGAASAFALAVDWSLLVFLTKAVGLHYLISSAIGFCAGLGVAYVQSVAFVFRDRSVSDPRREFALFGLIGLIGLGVTQTLLYLAVTYAGASYTLAKGPIAGAVFVMNFGLRRAFLFSSAGATRRAAFD